MTGEIDPVFEKILERFAGPDDHKAYGEDMAMKIVALFHDWGRVEDIGMAMLQSKSRKWIRELGAQILSIHDDEVK